MTASVISHRYEPRGACRDAHMYRGPEIVLSGPAGTGKSRALLEKLHLIALSNPGMSGLIMRKTQVSMTSTALVTYREHVAKEWIDAGEVRWYGGSQQEAAQYRYRNGSRIVVGGMDKPTKIMSSEYDMIYVQEAIELTETDWESLTTRLRNGKVSYQQLMADTNPDTPTHWLKQRADKGSTLMLESRHTDNPVLFGDDGAPTVNGQVYLDLLSNLTGVRKLRLERGLWVAAEGIIWDEWDPAVHVVDRPNDWTRISKDWPRFWSVDFGFTNPFVCQRWAQDPDGRLILYAETYRTRTLVEDHARRLAQVLDKEPAPRWIVCDHDAEGRATFERHLGRSTIPAIKNVTAGIQAVAARFKVAGDGRPRLQLMRSAVDAIDQQLVERKRPTSTLDEVPGYVWENNSKEQPLKIDDHGCDAMRYMVAQLDTGARPGIRWLG